MRSTVVHSRIRFLRPFSLKGVSDIQPAGSYSIETCDRYDWMFPFVWKKKTVTIIRLCTKSGLEGGLREFELDPRELFWALERDRRIGAD